MSIYSDMYLSWLHISNVMVVNYNAGGFGVDNCQIDLALRLLIRIFDYCLRYSRSAMFK